jgi:hypothetical protein
MKKILIALLALAALINARATPAQTWTMFSPGPFGQICKSDTTWICQAATAPDIAATYVGLSGCTGAAALLFNSTCAPIPSVPTSANPTAKVGLTAVNGATGNWMDAGSAPPLDQSISPTWTGTHVFTGPTAGVNGVSLGVGGGDSTLELLNSGAATDSKNWHLNATASIGLYFSAINDARSAEHLWLQVLRTGITVTGIVIGNATDLPPITLSGSVIVGGPTGGFEGPGTINAQNLFVNGVPVSTAPTPLSGTTGSLGGSLLAAGSCSTTTVSVTGATTSMAVVISGAGGTDPGGAYQQKAWVSSAGTVTAQVCAVVAGTPAAQTYNLRVIQ